MKKPSTQLKISARNAGQVELEKFCPRCCWYLLRIKNMPFQIGMPGIMFYVEALEKAYIFARLLEVLQCRGTFGPFSRVHRASPISFPCSQNTRRRAFSSLLVRT